MPALAPATLQPGACPRAGVVTTSCETTYDFDHHPAWGADADLPAVRSEAWQARSMARSAGLVRVALDRVPDEVDGAWWTRHAHLLRDLDDSGRLFLEPGSARSWAQPDVTPERISSTSGDWARAFTRRVRRLRNVEKSLRACQGQDPHVVVMLPEGMLPEGMLPEGMLPEGVDPAALASLISDAARRPLGIGAGLRSADRTTASSLLAGLPDGGVLFLDRSSLGKGPGHDGPGDDAHELSIAWRAVLIEALARGSLTHEVSDGLAQRDITLWLPWLVIVVISSDEAQDFDPGVAAREGAGATRVESALPDLPNVRQGAPNMGQGAPNVRQGAPNVRRTGPSMLWTP